ncbi:alpha/beta hydrolase fold family protein [Athelia psychrophila]|uniref:Alpha/beta hydrolase fold family protein n=1 Tax=Athelia psychrophila TaxID=1759441 RepID=A0A167WCR3_9AGAM|nr:alpha/beta hydrolase fold family protein [Fibularhizoctonia sp. CBS 109695]
MTSADLHRPQFENATLTDAMNLLAIEPLGHGQTRCATEHFTYWDTAIMSLQVLEQLGINTAFALGTSQGGWIVARMALLAPDKILGIIPLGTSMDAETPRSRALGCWDIDEVTDSVLALWTTLAPTPDFALSAPFVTTMVSAGFGSSITRATREFWTKEFPKLYAGDDGRRRARMAVINLHDRDGLHSRLFDVKCPVLWLHGTADEVYSVRHAEAEIKLFVNACAADLVIVEGGAHFLNASHPDIVNPAIVEFVNKWARNRGDYAFL